MPEKTLTIPLKEKDIRELKLRDVVYFSGLIFTGRSLFHIRAIEKNILPPIDFKKLNLFVHIGPVMKEVDDSWQVVSMMPTSSLRFERYGGAVIRKLGIKAVIGKTTMGENTMKVMKEEGCAHLTVVGLCGNTFAKQVKRVVDVYFLDELGKTEATWVMEIENAGPFIVDIDTNGNNLFYEINARVQKAFKNSYKRFGIREDFVYTKVNP